MIDYKNYYEERYNFHLKNWEEKYNLEVLEREGPKNDYENRFFKEVNWRKDNIIQTKVPQNIDNRSYYTKENFFKKDLLYRFEIISSNYPKTGINGFVKYDIPSLKQLHQNWYNEGKIENYESDPEFMFNASNEDIIDLIAEYNSIADLRINNGVVYSKFDKRNEEIDKNSNKIEKQGTLYQIILLLDILNQEYDFIKTEKYKPFKDFILFLSGKNEKNISMNFGKFQRLEGEVHSKSETIIEDLEAVKKVIEQFDNEKLSDIIDRKIKKQIEKIQKKE